MTLNEAIAETIRRAEKDQEFLRRTLARRRAEAAAEEKAQQNHQDRQTRHQPVELEKENE
jgi:hypothetical protein